MINLNNELKETIKVWSTASKVIFTVHNQASHSKAQKLLDELIDSVCENEDPIKESLIETLGTLIKAYEDKHMPEPVDDPTEPPVVTEPTDDEPEVVEIPAEPVAPVKPT